MISRRASVPEWLISRTSRPAWVKIVAAITNQKKKVFGFFDKELSKATPTIRVRIVLDIVAQADGNGPFSACWTGKELGSQLEADSRPQGG